MAKKIEIGLIGTERFSNKIIRLLASKNIHCFQCIKIINVLDQITIIEPFKKQTCLVFTSVFGASLFKPIYLELKKRNKLPRDLKVAAIGPATRKELETFVKVDFMPNKYTTLGLEKQLISLKDNISNLVLFRSMEADNILDIHLSKYFNVKRYNLYHLENTPADNKTNPDYLIFGSSFGVNKFYEENKNINSNVILCCLSEKTKKTLRKYYKNKIIVADNATAEDLAKAVLRSIE